MAYMVEPAEPWQVQLDTCARAKDRRESARYTRHRLCETTCPGPVIHGRTVQRWMHACMHA
eukprot:364650-Chlamydomonas_euryale.AAC.4